MWFRSSHLGSSGSSCAASAVCAVHELRATCCEPVLLVRKPDTHMTRILVPVALSFYEYEYVDRIHKTSRFMLHGRGVGTQVSMRAVQAIARVTGSTASVRPHCALIDKT